MKLERMKTRQYQFLAGAVWCVLLWFGSPAAVSAQNMADYTNYPVFLNQTVQPNILFLVDMGNFTLQAAYSGPNHQYPISFKTQRPRSASMPSNVTVDSQTGDDLVAVNNSGVVINTSNEASPADTFVSTKSYYGMFDPLRCYTTDSNSFNYGSVKARPLHRLCLHLLGRQFHELADATQKRDDLPSAGGRASRFQRKRIPYGTANNLNGEPKTGENGSTASCSNNSNSCWRYVKFVPAATLTGRIPTTLPTATVNLSGGGSILSTAGRIFGVGDGKLYVNDNGTATPFDTANSNKYSLEVDLRQSRTLRPEQELKRRVWHWIPTITVIPTLRATSPATREIGLSVCSKR